MIAAKLAQSLYVLSFYMYASPLKNRLSSICYMICASLTLIDPAVARIPLNIPSMPFYYQVLTFVLTDLILLALIFVGRNQVHGRVIFPLMLTMFLFFQGLNLTWTDSLIWDSFSMWFAKLPLT